MDATRNDIPRGLYAAIVAVATLCAFALAALVCTRLGGDAPTLRRLMIALGAGTFASLVPAVLRISKEYWGLAVVVAGVARCLVLFAICFAALENDPTLLKRPLMLGAAAAGGLLLIVETVAAIKILARLDRVASASRAGALAGHPTA